MFAYNTVMSLVKVDNERASATKGPVAYCQESDGADTQPSHPRILNKSFMEAVCDLYEGISILELLEGKARSISCGGSTSDDCHLPKPNQLGP